MFIIDPATGKILLVQSRGKLWGPPKGTIEHGETEIECAIREVKEETGLDININMETKSLTIKGRSTYYYVEIPECEVNIQSDILYNDVNAIGWIHPKCLSKCIENGSIFVTQQGRIVHGNVFRLLFTKYFVCIGKQKIDLLFRRKYY